MRAVVAECRAEGGKTPVAAVCSLLGVPRSAVYCEKRQRAVKPIDGLVANLVYEIIPAQPEWGVRLVWSCLRFEVGVFALNIKKVARTMRLEGWTMRQRRAGQRPRVEHRKSVATRPDERWATDVALVHCGMGGWCAVVPVIDCCTLQVLGWELAATAEARTAERALEDALLASFGHCRSAPQGLVVRHDNGLVFGSKRHVATVAGYGLRQEYIAPYTPEQEFVWHRSARSRRPAGRLRLRSASTTGLARTRG